MSLTPAQLATLKADIAADHSFDALPHNSDGAFAVAAAYNLAAAPVYYVWRSNVPMNEIMFNGFDWTRVDNLTVGKARIWEWMAQMGSINAAQANVRAGVLAVFGTAGDLAIRTAIFGHCSRAATRAEKLFATGDGAEPTEQGSGPSVMTFEGKLSYFDV